MIKFREYPERTIRFWIAAPIIYIMFFPTLMIHISMEIYQALAFPLCGITKVKRSNYISIDRHKLSKLTRLEKFNCLYCGYSNGVYAFTVAIGAATESFWCNIEHEEKNGLVKPSHHNEFKKYDNYK